MIVAFIADKMSSYVAGGMSAESAARFTRGELEAIYKGEHRSRDTAGAFYVTPPPEALSIEAAMKKADTAIAEIIRQLPTHEKSRTVYKGLAAIESVIAAGIGIKEFFAKSKDNDPAAYTTDLKRISALWNDGRQRFKTFINGRFLVLDIGRKPGKTDGLEIFYRLFPRETLPAELQSLPESFPCYVQTPSGGFHLYFRYEGSEVKLHELAPGIEIKEWQITTPGSRRENGDYILHGELDKAPALYGLIIDAIKEVKEKKEQVKAEHSRPMSAKAAKVKSGFEQMAEYARNPA